MTVSRSRPVPPVKPSKFLPQSHPEGRSHLSLDRQKSLSLDMVLERPEKPLCSFTSLFVCGISHCKYIIVHTVEIRHMLVKQHINISSVCCKFLDVMIFSVKSARNLLHPSVSYALVFFIFYLNIIYYDMTLPSAVAISANCYCMTLC